MAPGSAPNPGAGRGSRPRRRDGSRAPELGSVLSTNDVLTAECGGYSQSRGQVPRASRAATTNEAVEPAPEPGPPRVSIAGWEAQEPVPGHASRAQRHPSRWLRPASAAWSWTLRCWPWRSRPHALDMVRCQAWQAAAPVELLHTTLSRGPISQQLQEFLVIGTTAAVRHGLNLAASGPTSNPRDVVIDLSLNSVGALLLVVAFWLVRQQLRADRRQQAQEEHPRTSPSPRPGAGVTEERAARDQKPSPPA